jgi:hypothetical protein
MNPQNSKTTENYPEPGRSFYAFLAHQVEEQKRKKRDLREISPL